MGTKWVIKMATGEQFVAGERECCWTRVESTKEWIYLYRCDGMGHLAINKSQVAYVREEEYPRGERQRMCQPPAYRAA